MASHLSHSDGIEVEYSPFHSVHGKNIVLSENGCVARRERGYDKAIVFSSCPIPLDGRFQLAIRSEEQEWSGSLVSIGVPSVHNAPCRRDGADNWRLTFHLMSSMSLAV